ncbi:gamma-glutamyltransferase [Pseudoxanthomonas broegbernensis]|uniref:Glutathione hydrolase proenzyme n=1 Tax=Pseudoxanthomonas broegbernensis TaxID=83619 RepID=A0A7V8GQD2_9GAMM|nr:gamma-glutamyltransferase [Pseudoxanthomonas broegbernensis]KAF1688149.1 gamma-glutamyltransferase [Pseudoxanthomonas broegbernensis]MBB6065199.1 gamma-glutamyltranspeptidase/glutathione hydrolase [Pseudoxanthomonas broegbernensis]
MTFLPRLLWLAFLLVPVLPAAAADAVAADSPGTHAPAAQPRGAAIASAHALATEAGFEALENGGNAFDAAVAVSAALSVVEPISSGLGGGGFFLLHRASDGHDVFLDARETAPAAADPARYRGADGKLDREHSQNGPWAAAIPGLPAALVHLARDYGRLPLSASLAPAIRLARDGFPVYERLERGYAARREVMERYPGTRAVFLAGGGPPRTGQVLKQPDLARTLEALAGRGFDGFYRGPVAKKLLAGVRAQGGRWTAEELAGYTVKEREPLRFAYRGWEIVTAPPPSSGGVALAQMLQVLAGWDLGRLDPAHRAHLAVEAMRRAYRDRTFYLGDPDFAHVPVDVLTSPYYAAGLRATINPEKATPSDSFSGLPTPLEDEETTHFSIIDAQGNRVGATQTVNLLFGSGLVPPGTGVLLNNEMDDFALLPGQANAFGVMGFEANAPEPGKRPLSSMTPTFMVSPDKVAVLGTPGGSRIITMVLLGVLGYADGLGAQDVAALPRYHHQWLPDVILAEPGAFDAATAARLRAMGHALQLPEDTVSAHASSHAWGNLQTVLWDRGANKLSSGSDPRNPAGKGEVRATTEPAR